MTTARTMRNLARPEGRKKIPGGTLGFVSARTRSRMFNLIRREFAKSGITKAELADRLGKGPDQISHWLSSPGNLTIDTVGQLLFAISASEISDKLEYPLEQTTEEPQLEGMLNREQPIAHYWHK